MTITPTTDLTALIGVPVLIVRNTGNIGGPDSTYTYTGVFDDLWHSPDTGCAGGILRIDGQPGTTGFALPYGQTTVKAVA